VAIQFSDAARLLSFYQNWLDDLFPKATFLDALGMVEKLGHKNMIRNARLKWIDDGRPRTTTFDDDDDDPFAPRDGNTATEPAKIAPIFEKAAAQGRQKTPGVPDDDEDLFGDVDVVADKPGRPGAAAGGADIPSDDDLDALMAENEASAAGQSNPAGPSFQSLGSIFGNGLAGSKPPVQTSNGGGGGGGEPDDDDLDALMAEAEAHVGPSKPKVAANGAGGSIFGNGPPKKAVVRYLDEYDDDDDDDLDALMAEAETQGPSTAKPKVAPKPAAVQPEQDDDDLDALMAEAELGSQPNKTQTPAPSKGKEKEKVGDPRGGEFDEDEAAMAEMDGLW